MQSWWKRAFLVGFVILTAALAGCVGNEDAPADDGTNQEQDHESTNETAPLPEFRLEGTNCVEGGGQSVHPRSIAGDVPFHIPPAPWERGDVLEDTGPQLVYSEVTDPMNPVPSEGHTWGNIHTTLWCEQWTFNGEDKPGFVFGYVGAKVEDPPFSDGVPARSWLVTVVAANDAEVRAALEAAGIHATDTAASMEVDEVKLHTVLDTDHNGRYESLFALKHLGDMPTEPFRLWWQHANDNDTFTPVSLNLAHPTPREHFAAEGQSYFSHTGTHMHGPQGGIAGKTAAVAWIGHDRVITLGPRPDVAIDGAYEH